MVAWVPTTNGFNRFASSTRPDEVPIDEGADNTINNYFSVYYKDFPAGTFNLRQPDNSGRNTYSAVIGPQPGVQVPITLFAGAQSSIPEGGSAMLSWKIAMTATSATIDNGVGNVLPLDERQRRWLGECLAR